MRLKDHQKINQETAAEIIGISQPTLHRILNSARGKTAKQG
ncbi:DUF134 domain-containing protein [Methanobacterium sp.]|nr:DUF134 domain-containing protein [Methanobacterium sp.]MDY9923238.1 DUF134 domain-containing protein [Methanobacterium sp.]